MNRIILVGLLFVTYSKAQIMVISQNKVVFSKMNEYHELMEKHWNPIFDKLVDEGKLDEVGTLSHGWGDEWNVVGYYKAKDMASFEKACGRYVFLSGVSGRIRKSPNCLLSCKYG